MPPGWDRRRQRQDMRGFPLGAWGPRGRGVRAGRAEESERVGSASVISVPDCADEPSSLVRFLELSLRGVFVAEV